MVLYHPASDPHDPHLDSPEDKSDSEHSLTWIVLKASQTASTPFLALMRIVYKFVLLDTFITMGEEGITSCSEYSWFYPPAIFCPKVFLSRYICPESGMIKLLLPFVE